jgi:hypothetical protein
MNKLLPLRPLAGVAALWMGLVAGCASSESQVAPAVGQPATAGAAPASAAVNGSGTSASLEAQLKQAIGDASCNSDAQCHTLAWGTKACGGPERWVAWSSMHSDAATIESLGRRYATARREDHHREGGVSTCMIQADPGARCVAQHCALTTEAAKALE